MVGSQRSWPAPQQTAVSGEIAFGRQLAQPARGPFHRHPDGASRYGNLVVSPFRTRAKLSCLQLDDSPNAVLRVNNPVIDLNGHGAGSHLQAPRRSSWEKNG